MSRTFASIRRFSTVMRLLQQRPPAAAQRQGRSQNPNTIPELEVKRIIPALPTFYSSNPLHDQNVQDLTKALRKHVSFPYDLSRNATVKWFNFEQYKQVAGGSRLKVIQHQELLKLLNRLSAIDPQLQNDDLVALLNKFKVAESAQNSRLEVPQLDANGRAIAVGRRKASSAKVYLVRGEGHVMINNSPLVSYLPRSSDRLKVTYPLKVTDSEGKYNVFVKVRGGGLSGQAGAISLGISRALVIHNPLLKSRLYKAGCMTRDHRVVERKKPGKVKARKSPTWVKR
ncbi:BA75_00149T0 [Komagataella pastoris]|uniref:Small ribosomal subunit protein uS9m n=1 Tax=Komagataella pastoris TaxID=4922 RepID=A0A1B2J5F5_PICPA|nr:BA75_00149T0 [Komagataella pastoris]